MAIYARDLAFGDALLAPELAAGHQSVPLLNEILVQAGQPAAVVAGRLRALAQRYPGLRVSDSAALVTANAASDALDQWLGPFFVAMIFAFTSIAVVNTLIMIALRRCRELALLPLSHALTGGFRPYAPGGWLAAILGVSALLVLVASHAPGPAHAAGRGDRDPGVAGAARRADRAWRGITPSLAAEAERIPSWPG